MGSLEQRREPIAIIGLSCKFAGEATNADGLWRVLREKQSTWSEIPESRFNAKSIFNDDKSIMGTMNVRGAHFIREDISQFDAPFFNLSTEAASALDPQVRLQLESVYEALESAGITLDDIQGTDTCVFTGLWKQDYKDGASRDGDNSSRYHATGTGGTFSANRISHFFDLNGPSVTIDTACSTSLVALHQAVQSLRSQESDVAIVAASNLMLNADTFTSMASAGFLSPDGKCYAFDSRANGYGRGDGVATIIIKRLSEAVASHDHIWAVVRETAVNQDGKTESITTPSEEAQVKLMKDCYKRARLNPDDTQYFEAHGTGTSIGDPIETRAISRVFNGSSRQIPLLIGSVKSNIGHTEVTSGLAAIIKVALAMRHNVIPASININVLNPAIPFDEWNLQVARDSTPWPSAKGTHKTASINSFGYGGTNAHAILESPDYYGWYSETQYDQQERTGLNTGIITLSAKSDHSCQAMVADLIRYLENDERGTSCTTEVNSLLYTLSMRRNMFSWNATAIVPLHEGIQSMIEALQSPKCKVSRASHPRLAFVFTGQGAQWYAMGRELILHFPVFKKSLQASEHMLEQMNASWSLFQEISRDPDKTKVHDVSMSIPICVAVQIALVDLLDNWNIHPVSVTSHSSGEIAAAYTVGALDHKSAMAVAYHRAVLTAQKGTSSRVKGGMVAVGVGPEKAQEYLDNLCGTGVAVAACINSPSSVTVSGDLSAVEEVEARVKADGVFARRLRVDSAYHSHHMVPVAQPYREALHDAKLVFRQVGHISGISYSSPVTGGLVTDFETLRDPEHWVRSLLQPVLFVDAFQDMVLGDSGQPTGNQIDHVIEIGPHTALGSGIKEILMLPECEDLDIKYHGTLVRDKDAVNSMHELSAELAIDGVRIGLKHINFPHGLPTRTKVLPNLPSYPWSHSTQYWNESRLNKAMRNRSLPFHILLGSVAPWANPEAPVWKRTLRVNDNEWLRDHCIESVAVFPAGGYICLAMEAIKTIQQLNGWPNARSISMQDIQFESALVIPDDDRGIELQTSLTPDTSAKYSGSYSFHIHSITVDGKWTKHATGMVKCDSDTSSDFPQRSILTSLPGCATFYDVSDFYAALKRYGMKQGTSFQNLQSIVQPRQKGRSVCRIGLAEACSSNNEDLILHPTTVTSIIQAAYTSLPHAGNKLRNALIPSSIQKLKLFSAQRQEWSPVFQATSSMTSSDEGIITDIHAVASGGQELFEIRGLLLKPFGEELTDQNTGHASASLQWYPDLTLSSPAWLSRLKSSLVQPMDATEKTLMQDLRRVCIYFLQQGIQKLSADEVDNLKGHFVKLFTWAKEQLKLAQLNLLDNNSRQWLEDDISTRQLWIDKISKATVNGEMVCRLGPQLANMLRGTQAPLEIMMEDHLLFRYYKDMLKIPKCLSQTSKLLDMVLNKNPRARVLEIGGGTGGATRYMLPTVGIPSSSRGARASLYHFTDISAGFFGSVTDEFTAWSDIFQCNVLDIEKSPSDQGFEEGSYDVIVACQVLHATASMKNTMTNVRRLLKPGGRLLLVETTKDQCDVQFVFGLLPGWWLSQEPERHDSPSLSIPMWEKTLTETGFSGLDLHIRDCESDEFYSMSTIMSVALPMQSSVISSTQIALVIKSEKERNVPWVQKLFVTVKDTLKTATEILSLETAREEQYVGYICICLFECAGPIMTGLSQATLQSIQQMTTACKGLLWVSRTAENDPALGLSVGLLRTLRNEYLGRQFVSLNLDSASSMESDTSTASILKVLATNFHLSGASPLEQQPVLDVEYRYRDGAFHVPRFIPAANQDILAEAQNITPSSSSDTTSATFTQQVPKQESNKGLLETGASSISSQEGSGLSTTFSPNISYMLIGGMGPLAAPVALWLLENGARNIIIISEEKTNSDLISQLETEGCRVHCIEGGGTELYHTKAEDTFSIDGMPAIGGILYFPAICKIERFDTMSHEDACSADKSRALAFNIHSLFTERGNLDFLILLTSLSGVMGASGHCEQAMTAAYLDELARWRCSTGHRTIAVTLPIFKAIPHSDHNSSLLTLVEEMPITEADVTGILDAVFSSSASQQVYGINNKSGRHWDSNGTSALGRDPRFIALQDLALHSGRVTGNADQGSSLAEELGQVQSLAEAESLIADMVVQKIANIFSMSVDDIDTTKPPASFGIDSLVAVELRNMFSKKAGSEVSSFEILQAPSLKDLVQNATSKSSYIGSHVT